MNICELCGITTKEEIIEYGDFKGCKSHKKNGIKIEIKDKIQEKNEYGELITKGFKTRTVNHKIDMSVCKQGYN